MVRGWGFLLGEIWVLIALAALVGLFVGWLVWGRRAPASAPAMADSAGADRLRADLAAAQSRATACAERVAALEAEIAAARMRAETPVETADSAGDSTAGEAAPVAPETAPEPPAAPEPAPETVGTRPAALTAPRGGQPDDLKRIKGIGPKLEALCNRLGFWHFDQIAGWSDAEIAWVDANLEAFKGRVTRDDWVAQARALAQAPRD